MPDMHRPQLEPRALLALRTGLLQSGASTRPMLQGQMGVAPMQMMPQMMPQMQPQMQPQMRLPHLLARICCLRFLQPTMQMPGYVSASLH